MCKFRKDVTPRTETAYYSVVADMAAKNTVTMLVLEDFAAVGNSDFDNSQDILDYLVQMKKESQF